MPAQLDLKNWNRRDQFHFFKNYDHPYFTICAPVEIGPLLKLTREQRFSFFLATLYLSIKTANEIQEFRFRLNRDRVIIHEVVHPGSTVLNSDGSFRFCYFDYTPDFSSFHQKSSAHLEQQSASDDSLDPRAGRDDLVYYTVIPWISFTSFSHAQSYKANASIPKIAIGKYYNDGGIIKMPVSVEVHHALMDGIHVGDFFERFQRYAKTDCDILLS